MHYCDHNANSPLRGAAKDAIAAALATGGNPSAVHGAGRAARAIIDMARDQVAKLAGAQESQVIFTSGATEANNLALWGAVEGGVRRLLVSAIEHSSVLKTAQAIAARLAEVRLEILPVTADGVVDIAALREALELDAGHTLVAVMAANNETGVIQPIGEVSRLCRQAGALLLVDAVTAAGKIALDAALGDYMTLSAHKLGGPQGVGALIVGDEAPLVPQLTGGGQQKGRRAGTENLSGIAGFGAAAQAVMADGAEAARVAALRDYFEAALGNALPDAIVLGGNSPRLCSTSCVALPGLSGENIVIALDLDGVCASSGSSCSSGKISPSHVLAAMGLEPRVAGASLRVSFGWNSVQADADAAVAGLTRLSQRARSRAA